MLIKAKRAVNGDVAIRIDQEVRMLPIERRIADTDIFATFQIPQWFTHLWRTEKAAMKTAGFTMRKRAAGWEIQYRDRAQIRRDIARLDAQDRRQMPTIGTHGVSSDVSDYHAWLDRVSANLPMPVPTEVDHD